jgi:glycosyltransferase involved in cell wall biosynthesis
MKILFVSYCPLSINGISKQLYEIVVKLKSVKKGFVCLNIPTDNVPTSLTFEEYTKKVKCRQFKDNDDKKVFEESVFYLPGNIKDIWEKIEFYYNDFKPDKILFYSDIDIFGYYNIGKLKCELYLWLPIHTDFRENVYSEINLSTLPIFDKIATFSNFGMEVLKSYNYNPVFINHCVDKNVFYKKYSKEETRKEFNIPQDSFVCLINAKNNCPMDRKAFIEQINAFNAFSENKNTLLLLKTNPTECLNLTNLLTKKTKILNKCFSIDTVVKFYCMSDVLLSASKSEGFGIPIVEAQFCGLPVITSNCTAMPENTYNGICTEPSDVSLKVNGLNSWSDPSVDNIKSAIEKIYSGEYTPREFDKEKYNNTFEDWKAFLDI